MNWTKTIDRIAQLLIDSRTNAGLDGVRSRMPKSFWAYVAHFAEGKNKNGELGVLRIMAKGRVCLCCSTHPVSYMPFVPLPNRGTFREDAWRYGKRSAFCIRCLAAGKTEEFREANRLTMKDWMDVQRDKDPVYARMLDAAKDKAQKTRVKTNLQRWGAANPMLSDKGRRNHRRKCRLAFGGVDNAMYVDEHRAAHSKAVKNRDVEAFVAKCKATSVRRYGVDHWTKVPGAYEASMRERYGVANAMDLPGVREKHAKSAKRAGAEGKTRHLGKDNGMRKPQGRARHQAAIDARDQSLMAAKRRATWKQKYGVDHYMHVPEIAKKVMTAAYGVKKAKLRGKTYKYQGYELAVLAKLIGLFGAKDVIGQYETECPCFSYEGKTYYPDIFVASKRTVIEVKGVYTLFSAKRLKRKAEAVISAGYSFRVYVAAGGDVTDKIVRLPDTWATDGPIKTAAFLIQCGVAGQGGRAIPKRIRAQALALLAESR